MKKFIILISLLFLSACLGPNYPDGCKDGKGIKTINIEFSDFVSCNGSVYYVDRQKILSPNVNKIDYDFITKDLKNFKVLTNRSGKDKERLYLIDDGINKYKLETETLDVIGQSFFDSQFYKNKDGIYRNGKDGLLKIMDIDKDTFQIVSLDYAKDKDRVYYSYSAATKEKGILFFKNKYYKLDIVDNITPENIEEKEFLDRIKDLKILDLGKIDTDKLIVKPIGKDIYIIDNGNNTEIIYVGGMISQEELGTPGKVGYDGFNLGTAPYGFLTKDIKFEYNYFISKDEYYYIVGDELFYNGKKIGKTNHKYFKKVAHYLKDDKDDIFKDDKYVYHNGKNFGSSKGFKHINGIYYKNDKYVFIRKDFDLGIKILPDEIINAENFKEQSDGIFSDGGQYKFDEKGHSIITAEEAQDLRDKLNK